MMPLPPTDAQVEELRQDLRKFTRSFFQADERRASIRLALKAIGIAALVGLAAAALIAFGQGLAIGFRPAYAKYGIWWVFAPALAIGAVIAIFLSSLCFYVLPFWISDWFWKLFSDRAKQILKKVGDAISFPAIVLLFLGIIVFLPIYMGYQITKQENQILAVGDAGDISIIANSVSQQQEAVRGISASARKMLSDLESTEKEIQRAREELATTVNNIELQGRSAAAANDRVKNLTDRQRQIELRIKEVEYLLDGRSVITREDLESSGRSGLVIGAILGFIGSLAATIIFERFLRSRKRARNSNDEA